MMLEQLEIIRSAIFNTSRSSLPIGVDIGAGGFRMVQLIDSSDGLSVHHSVGWVGDPGVGDPGVSDPGASDPWVGDPTADRIKHLLRDAPFSGRRGVVGLSPPDIETHPLELPRAAGGVISHELDKAAQWEIRRLTRIDSESIQTAIWPLPESKRAKATYMGVAVSQDQVESAMRICDAAGLNCVKVDVASCALANVIWRLRGRPANEVWGILDLGARHTRLAICVDDTPVIVRTFDMGGQVWTQRIATELKLSEQAAERNKIDLGLTGGLGDRQADAASKELSALIMGILRDDIQRVALETERSYEYVLQCYSPRLPGDLVMVGGGALLKGFDRYLAEKLGIEVYPAGKCPTEDAAGISAGLGRTGTLETCALACGLSIQGLSAHA